MTPENIIKALKLLNTKVPVAQQRPEWIVASCPLAPWTHDGGTDHNPAFAVRKEAGDPFCHCFACDWHGSLGELVVEMGHRNKVEHHCDVKWSDVHRLIEEAEENAELNLDSPDIEEMLFGKKAKPHVFPQWWLESFPVWREIGWAQDYLVEDRGISPAVADLLGVRADTTQKRVCFPVHDFKKRLMGLHGRAVEPGTDPRYRMYLQAGRNNPIIWLGESWVDLTKPIVVVEGPMDVASVMRVYRNVASPLFANPSLDKLRRMADALEWVTILDRGKGGDAGRAKISKALRRDHVVNHLEPPEGSKDPGAMSVQQLADLLGPLVPLDPEI